MDIGTAKPSKKAQSEIRHYGLDIVEPGEAFSVAEYLRHANRAVEEIRLAGAIPLAVGGTSLYIKAMTEGLFQAPQADAELRACLANRAREVGLAKMHAELGQIDPHAAGLIHPNDEKRILRALEVFYKTGTPISQLQTQWTTGPAKPGNTVLIGLRREREDLHARVNRRVKKMVQMGLVEEVQALLAEPAGLGESAAQAVGYAELIAYFNGREKSLDKAIERIKINTRRLAKKQRTWHRRWAAVRWFDIAQDESPQSTAERIAAEINFK
jgi:tRNA dimethylallyltransferase